jgi:D-3-phosphoglycerate dehydrogenase / 2-oxoglutarate reductase
MAKFTVMRVDRNGSDADLTGEAEGLAKLDAEIVGVDCTTEDEIIAAAKEADVIVTGGAHFTRRVLESLPKCQAIVRYGVGFDTIDVDAASDNNVIVVNIPASDWCDEEVSNQAIALLLASAKKLGMMNDYTKQGRWPEAKQAQAPMAHIHGQTLGLIACGSIGRMTGEKAQCFKMKVVAYDPYMDKSIAEESGITLLSLQEVLEQSDFISVHAPLMDSTYHLLGEEEFAMMKPGAYVINTARGPVIDEKAMIKALQEKRIAGAGLDVFEQEPVDPDNPLLKMDNVVVAPHSASYSDFSRDLQRRIVGQEAARVLSGYWPKSVVNKGVEPKAELKA